MIGVIDGHNDLPWRLRTEHDSRVDVIAREVPNLHTDLPRARRGGLVGQFWSVWVDPDSGADPVTATFEQIDLVHRMVAAHPDTLSLTPTAAGLRDAMAAGRIGGLIAIEGGAQLGGSPGVLRAAARLGVRALTLTWTRTTDWADSSTDDARHGGLTDFGRDIVRELNRIGVLVDLAHTSADTMSDALDIATRPAIVSHAGAAALCDHPRNVSDALITRLADSGGVQMVTFVPSFLSPERRAWVLDGQNEPPPPVGITDVADHLDHVRDIAGVTGVGIGGDFDGVDALPEGLHDVSGYPALLDELRRRHWSESDLAAVSHGNVLRVIAECDPDYVAFLSHSTGGALLSHSTGGTFLSPAHPNPENL